MSKIKECKQYIEKVKSFDQRLTKLIKDISEHSSIFQSLYQQSDDEEMAAIAEKYNALCSELKGVRKRTDQHSQILSELNSRLKRLKSLKPSLFQRLFLRKRIASRNLA